MKIMSHKNPQKCDKRSFCLTLLNMQYDLCIGHQCPYRPGMHGNRKWSSILSSGTEVECANHSSQRQFSIRKNEKYVAIRSNCDTTGKEIMNEL